jgi:hypothetical protein
VREARAAQRGERSENQERRNSNIRSTPTDPSASPSTIDHRVASSQSPPSPMKREINCKGSYLFPVTDLE